MHGETIKFEIL